jgi:hypothetical protein
MQPINLSPFSEPYSWKASQKEQHEVVTENSVDREIIRPKAEIELGLLGKKAESSFHVENEMRRGKHSCKAPKISCHMTEITNF